MKKKEGLSPPETIEKTLGILASLHLHGDLKIALESVKLYMKFMKERYGENYGGLPPK